MATAIIHSDEYLKHDTGDHPERRERYRAAINGLMADADLWSNLVKIAPIAATDDELLRCHTSRAVSRVHQACEQAVLFEQVALDADTIVSEQSDVVARLAAGGACRAVDAVVRGEAESAFVACRPPGHHATVGQAMGFCLYNNTAVAARYAQAVYPEQIKQVLIVDFDVHHGNGTQDIFYDDPSVFYYSLHQYPWYPGTGGANERGVREGEGFTLNIPMQAMTPADDYLRMFEQGLEKVMKTFSPDLVIISAGFDAHASDPLGQLTLTDESYRRMTQRLKEAARTKSSDGKGRVVSCLEGGYNLRTLGETIRTHVAALE
ncbi:MAG TPA: histone deacetylase [Blastocatellia bacterium]|nr:histone deacetylase [Blastocatellia bacterium]HMV85927.1 histone deacetylase [Blastocatellia bacterium]HMX30203.1 histone deacetylase [Blastocatellia bacterium]HMZ19625.1 histone deacetylase [Blastocatellia bacterium]HNG32799.1 histone deacetylase [Blastocatellia bacterium]